MSAERSLRNKLARTLLEGYDATPNDLRLALLEASDCLAVIAAHEERLTRAGLGERR